MESGSPVALCVIRRRLGHRRRRAPRRGLPCGTALRAEPSRLSLRRFLSAGRVLFGHHPSNNALSPPHHNVNEHGAVGGRKLHGVRSSEVSNAPQQRSYSRSASPAYALLFLPASKARRRILMTVVWDSIARCLRFFYGTDGSSMVFAEGASIEVGRPANLHRLRPSIMVPHSMGLVLTTWRLPSGQPLLRSRSL